MKSAHLDLLQVLVDTFGVKAPYLPFPFEAHEVRAHLDVARRKRTISAFVNHLVVPGPEDEISVPFTWVVLVCRLIKSSDRLYRCLLL